MKILYSVEDRRRAVAECWRVQSAPKAVYNLGYPARRTLYDLLRYYTARRKPKRTHLLDGNRPANSARNGMLEAPARNVKAIRKCRRG